MFENHRLLTIKKIHPEDPALIVCATDQTSGKAAENVMRNLTLTAIALFSLVLTSPATAETFEVAREAYLRGEYIIAASIWRDLAEEGEAAAQFTLGAIYTTGRGVKINHVQSYVWFQLAAEQGYKNAARNRSIVGSWLTAQQQEEAERLLAELRPE